MRRLFRYGCSVLVLALLVPAGAAAQTTSEGKLANAFIGLFTSGAQRNYQTFVSQKNTNPALQGLQLNQDDIVKQAAPSYFLVRLIGSQVSSLPLGTSAGGFTWTFDPAMGAFARSSESFGPTFAERALTVGKRKFSFGFNYQHSSYDNIEGKDLGDGSIKSYSTASIGGTTLYIQNAISITASSDTFDLYGTLGVSDRFDIGFAVPVVSVALSGGGEGRSGLFPGTISPVLGTESWSGSASGVGDIVLRAKYNVLKSKGGGIAAAADARLGTGDEYDLLGIPGSQLKMYAIGSATVGKLSPHFNVGYTASFGSDVATDVSSPLLAPPNEANYVGGVDWAMIPRATIAVDFVGRTLLGTGRLVDTPMAFNSAYSQFVLQDGNVNQALVAIGGKVNLYSTTLLSVNVLLPLTRTGLTGMAWTMGFDYSF